MTATLDAFFRQCQEALDDPALLATRQRCRSGFSPSISYGRHFGPPAPTARQAAVMIMLEPRDGAWTIPLTIRSDHIPDHPGQISLPGGRLVAHETPQQAAEREFVEELGCASFPGRVLGELLPLYVYNSNYYVRPFLAVSETCLHYVPCTREVASVLHLPISAIFDEHYQQPREFSRGLVHWTAPTICYHRHHIWGATAIILGELRALQHAGLTPAQAF